MRFEKYAVKNDSFDRKAFQDIRKNSESLKGQFDRNAEKLPTFDTLQQDVYSALYKYEPELESERRLDPKNRVHLDLIKSMMEMKEYKDLRGQTLLDEFASALATDAIAEKILEYLPPKEEEEQEGDGDGDGKGKKKRKKPNPDDIKNAIKSGLNDAKSSVNEANDCLAGWGLEKGQLHKTGYKEKVQLAQKIMGSHKLKELAKIAGRFRRLALSTQKTKVTRGCDEIFELERGDSLERVLPQELANLCHPVRKFDFYRRFTEKDLMQYQVRGKIKEAKGPIIIAMDESGSMSGEREIWAKAVGLALMEIAVSQKRTFGWVHFGSSEEIKTHVFKHQDGRPDIEQMIEMAEFFFGGGTDFESPLTECRKIIDGDLPKADVVFVTDGECGVNDEFLETFKKWKQTSGVNVYGVLMGTYGDEQHPTMDQFCDTVIDVAALEDRGGDHAVNVFQQI